MKDEMAERILGYARGVITGLEESETSLIYFVAFFLASVNLRSFLEVSFIHRSWDLMSLNTLLHISLFQVITAAVVITVLHFLTGKDVVKVSKVILTFFLLINMVPIVANALALFRPEMGFVTFYITPENTPDVGSLIRRFLVIGGTVETTKHMGYMNAIRIFGVMNLFFTVLYFYLHNSKLLKSVLCTLVIYLCVFPIVSSPWWLHRIFSIFGTEFAHGHLKYVYALVTTLLVLVLLYRGARDRFLRLLGESKPLRLTHHCLIFVFGAASAVYFSEEYVYRSFLLFDMVVMTLSITFAWLFYMMLKKMVYHQKYGSGPLEISEYGTLMGVFGVLSMGYGLLVSPLAAFLALVFMGNYFLYVSPPLYIRDIPIFSKLFVSANSLLLFMLGWWLVKGDMVFDNGFPVMIVPIIALGMTACVNITDLETVEHDRSVGRYSLAVIMGEGQAKLLIGLSFLLTYLSLYMIFDNLYVIIPCLIFGLTSMFLINRREYSETPVLLFYSFSLVYLILAMLLGYV